MITTSTLRLTLLLFFSILFQSLSARAQCNHIVRLTDTYGDGWNGGTVTISVNGTPVFTNITLASGYGPQDFTVSASTGQTINVTETAAGSYPTEMRVTVLNPCGTALSGPSDPAASPGTNVAADCGSPLTFSSATSASIASANAEICAYSQQMMRVEVVTTGCTGTLNLTSLIVNKTGTCALGDINRVHVYYTGTSSTFATTTEFVSGGMAPAASMNFTGVTQSLASGTNYFWVVYDMNGTGTVGQTVGAQLPTSPTAAVTIGGTGQPMTASPNGSSTFIACSTYSSGLTVWYKSDLNLTGNPVSSWGSSGGSAGVYNLTQGTVANQPAVIAGSTNYKYFNYQKRLNWVAASNTLLTNSGTATDMMGGTAGSIFLIVDQQNIDGTVFCYSANLSTARYQLKPQWRFQSSNGTNGTTYDWSGTAPANAPREAAYLISSHGANTGMTIRRNSVVDNTADNSNNATYNPAVSLGLSLGRNGTSGEDSDNDMAEVMLFSTALSSSQIARVESYLSLKYGLTRGNNSGTSSQYNYLSSTGATIFDKTVNSGYNNDIAGIGRDDGSSLNQKQSISVNTGEPVSIGLTTIASENTANAATFSSNNSFLIWGNNGLITETQSLNPVCFSQLPAGVEARILRVWRAQNTNMAQTVTVGFEDNIIIANTPVSNLRLLVDNDGTDWTNATVYSGCVLNTGRLEFSGVTLNNTKPYFTLATINYLATPLPVGLTYFKAEENGDRAALYWETESEQNCEKYEVERSIDGENWEFVFSKPAAGNSSETIQYSGVDAAPYEGISYYRLKQIDLNGDVRYSKMESVVFYNTLVNLAPNPAENDYAVSYLATEPGELTTQLVDALGKAVQTRIYTVEKGENSFVEDVSSLTNGIYFLTLQQGNKPATTLKLQVLHH